MPINQDRLEAAYANQADATEIKPKRGAEIFAGTDYPRTWPEFVGQAQAKEQLVVGIKSASARGVRMEHTLLASGIHGIGKTTLAHLVVATAGVGLIETTGPLAVEEARELMLAMDDRDVLFVDEAHLLVTNGRTKADWLLPFMTEGKLYGKRGAEQMPDITLLAATTDAGRLPDTLLSRFMVQPPLVAYSNTEAAAIAQNLAGRMGVNLPEPEHTRAIAIAADSNPRAMRKILTAVRDLQFVYSLSHPNLGKAFEYAGVSPDGLSQIARDILLVLLTNPDYTASIDFIGGALGEPGPLKNHEKQLFDRGLATITGRGRSLTEAGLTRARAEFTAQMASRS